MVDEGGILMAQRSRAAHLEEGSDLGSVGEPGLHVAHVLPLGGVPLPEQHDLRDVPVVAVQHHQVRVAPMLLLEQFQPLCAHMQTCILVFCCRAKCLFFASMAHPTPFCPACGSSFLLGLQ